MSERSIIDCDFILAYYLLFGKQKSITLCKTKCMFLTSGGVNVFPKKRRRPMRKTKQRPLFSPHQIQTMEKEFAKQRYVTEEKRAQLALEVNLTEAQVKTWFQNRRTKWKKETRDEATATSRSAFKEDVPRMSLARPRINPFCQNICGDSFVNPFRVVAPFCAVPIYSTFASNPRFVSWFVL